MNNLEEILNILKQLQEQQGGATVETVEEQPNRFKADGISVSKGEVTSLSKQFTDLLNVFGKLANGEEYVADLQQSVNVAEQNYASERALESRSISQIPTSQGSTGEDLAGVLSGITKEIDLLSRSIQENGLGGQGGEDKEKQSEDSGSGLGSMLKTAAIAGAVALGGFLAGSASPARAAPRPSDGYGDSGDRARKDGFGGGGFGGGGATGTWEPATATPQITRDQSVRTSKYSDALSSNIEAGIEAAQIRTAAPAISSGGYSGGDTGGDTGGGGAINPPTSGMAGAIYQAAKQRGYDDHMAIAFVSVAEKESGLRPQAENMRYTPDRAREIFGAAAAQYAGNPRRFANYVYGPSTRKGRQLGNTGPEDGWNYRGKGLVQVTGKNNYRALSRVIGYDLIKDPDALINNSEIAIKGMFGFYESPSLGGSVVRGRKTARSQGEANRILTDATGGRVGFSSGSAFGRENLAKVNRISARYTAGGLASSAGTGGGGGGGTRLVGTGTFIHPTANRRITSRFGPRNTGIRGASRYHRGLDYGPVRPGTRGDPIYASAAGVVSFAGTAGGYGKLIKITHEGPLQGYETRYAHLNAFRVGVGDRVRQGQHIAALGSTGVGNAPHLHFEVRQRGTALNPISFLGNATVEPTRETEPTNEDSGRNVGNETDTGPAPTPRIRPQVDVPSAEVAIAKKMDECNCPPPIVIGGGQGSGPNPLQYLSGIKPPSSTKPVSRNPVAEYRIYFAA